MMASKKKPVLRGVAGSPFDSVIANTAAERKMLTAFRGLSHDAQEELVRFAISCIVRPARIPFRLVGGA